MNTVTLSTDGYTSTPLVCIDKRDWPICLIGLTLLKAEVEKAKKALTAIGLDAGVTAPREAEGESIRERLGDDSLGLPVAWLPTLRAALAIEYERVAKVQKTQGELIIPADETSARMQQLDRLLSELDVAQMAEAAA